MMEERVIAVLLCLLATSFSFIIKLPTLPLPPRTTNTDNVQKQKLILPLFENICDDVNNPMVTRLAGEFNMNTLGEYYKDPVVLSNLQNLISTKGLLEKGVIFTENNKDHLNELRIVSEVLLDTDDFGTFLKAASWAKINLNCGLYLDAIYIAVTNRDDMQRLSVPAPYELMPIYFINKKTIYELSSVMNGVLNPESGSIREDGNSYIIEANYTANGNDFNDDNSLSYFHEDIGLNTYYFLKRLNKLPWLNDNMAYSKYGEMFYHFMKQLAVRYDLERYSNGYDEIGDLSLEAPETWFYDPELMYSNGEEFSVRDKYTTPFTALKNMEDVLSQILMRMTGNEFTKENFFHNLMDLLYNTEDNYESVIMNSFEEADTKSPSVLSHYITRIRDPLFWRLNKKIVKMIENALMLLPSYTRNELYFPGIEVLNVDVKKISTSFDEFLFDVTSTFKDPSKEDTNSFAIKIAQQRLNHKPFTMKFNVSSLVAQKGLVKVFLGPKMMPGEFNMKKSKFMLLDYFEYTFKKGVNTITRNSVDMIDRSSDFLSLNTLYKVVENAEFGVGNLVNENIRKLIGFPDRLILPKGSEEGMPFQIIVMVAPFSKMTVSDTLTTTEFNSAIMSPGYPLDSSNTGSDLLNLPNVLTKEIVITHKSSSKGGAGGAGNWGANNENGEEMFDYSARKTQFGDKSEYGSGFTKREPTYSQYKKTPSLNKKFDYKKKQDESTTPKVISNDIKTTQTIFDYIIASTEEPIEAEYVDSYDYYDPYSRPKVYE